ncbi:MAG TPA: crotonase/enoyl-CoA hydratase family protein [Acidimicrobiia bacterium]
MVIERERRDRVGIIRINRPEARNAVNDEVSEQMETALDELEADGDIGAVVVTGTGEVFCAGADLKMVAQGKGMKIATERGGFGGFTSRDFPKPRIAAVNGPALAGGFEIVLACDLVVAADESAFGLPEVTRGLFAAAGGPFRLARRIPLATAIEIVLTGDPVDAIRAHALGLVNRLVPRARVLDEAVALANRIAENGPVAVRNSLRMMREAVDLTEAEAWPRSGELAREVFSSPDAIEGATAFAEKRAPRWTGA